jgi:hypothetical protein
VKRSDIEASPAPVRIATVSSERDDAAWGKLIRDDQWTHFVAGTTAIESTGVSFLLGGALALASYTGHWRDTKDVDVIVRPQDSATAIGALRSAGFEDYFDQLAYDRSWIFRGCKDGVIFDIIWELPNHRVPIDDAWFERARALWLRGRAYAAAPAEEIIRVKLYVMQRERCDWVDVLNLLSVAGRADGTRCVAAARRARGLQLDVPGAGEEDSGVGEGAIRAG